MNAELVVRALQEALPSVVLEMESIPIDEACITLPASRLRSAVEVLLMRLGVTHLSTITAEDTGREMVLLYHFWDRRGLTLRIELPREGARVESIADLIPGAGFYEQEIIEMLGVAFEGYSHMGPLFLPDDWDGPPPLRRTDLDV